MRSRWIYASVNKNIGEKKNRFRMGLVFSLPVLLRLRACMENDSVEEIRCIFADVGGNSFRDHNHWTLLGLAVSAGSLSVTKWLLENGCDVNEVCGISPSDLTPWQLCISQERISLQMMKLLAEHGALLMCRFEFRWIHVMGEAPWMFQWMKQEIPFVEELDDRIVQVVFAAQHLRQLLVQDGSNSLILDTEWESRRKSLFTLLLVLHRSGVRGRYLPVQVLQSCQPVFEGVQLWMKWRSWR